MYQTKLAEEKEQKFQELNIELKDAKEKYCYLIQQLRFALKQNNNVYKKAINDIKNKFEN